MYFTSNLGINNLEIAKLVSIYNEKKYIVGYDLEWNVFDGILDITRVRSLYFEEEKVIVINYSKTN